MYAIETGVKQDEQAALVHSEFLSHIRTILDFLVDNAKESELCDSDLIFVFGNFDERIPKHASLLLQKGIASRALITGKYGKTPIRGAYSIEADFFASVMEREGTLPSALILEREARNTLQNVLFGMKVLHERGIFPRRLTLCAAPFLLRRAQATFAQHFPEVHIAGSTYVSSVEDIVATYTTERVLGEIERLMSYAKNGDIAEVQIPDRVQEAHSAVSHAVHFGQ